MDGKVKSASSQVAHTAEVYPDFCSIKRLGVFVLPLECRVIPQHYFASTHLYTWVERSTIDESKVSCPRTQHSDPGQGSNLDCTNRSATSSHSKMHDTLINKCETYLPCLFNCWLYNIVGELNPLPSQHISMPRV